LAWSIISEKATWWSPGNNKTKRNNMSIKTLTVMAAIGLLAATTAFAQNAPGPRGKGYGGPPQSEAERAARQADCIAKNGGVCPQGGPGVNCPGKGQGQGAGYRRGACDGTGPRAGTGACPKTPVPAQK
jgi:hypothetical protein